VWQNRGRVTSIADFIKEFLVPGSAWFLVIAGSVSTALLFGTERLRTVGRTLLVSLLLFYWVMSLPVVAHGLQVAQRPRESTTSGGLPAAALPIVVLGNGLGGYEALGARIELPLGQTAMNALFAVDRYRRYPQSIVIASGGAQPGEEAGAPESVVIRDVLRRNDVPLEQVLLESTSTNTHEQAIGTSRILKERGERTCIVVTSPQQMSRAVELFRREGIAAIPLAAGSPMWAPSRTPHRWWWIVPSSEARAVSRDVVYELMAWPYYRLRGWIS
jgi:uncharacterized SAM-binding protein YcdF (DUF218 family)